MLSNFRILALDALSAGLPPRIKLFNCGRNDTAKGPVILSDASAEIFAANQRRLGRERVAVDFEHNSIPGMPEYERTSEPRPVAGYGVPRLIPGDGLYLEEIVATPEGERHAANYEDLSPAPWLEKDGTLVGLHSVALVRAGSVYGLTLAAAALASFSAGDHRAFAGIEKQRIEDETAYAESCVSAQVAAQKHLQRVKDVQKSRGWSFSVSWDYVEVQDRLARLQAGQR